MDYKKTAMEVVRLIGGKGNVNDVTHCMTRLRFNLKDIDTAKNNIEEVQNLESVIKVIIQNGQYQVVIGPQVKKVYDEVVLLTGNQQEVQEQSDTPNMQKEVRKVKISDKIMHLISGIIMPILPAFAGAGMIKSLVTILTLTGLLATESGTYIILQGIGDTAFYFLPIIVGGSAAKYFGMDMYIGSLLGASLIYPTFHTAATDGSNTTFSFLEMFTVTPKDYTSTIFPVVLSVWVAAVLYKQLKKIVPSIVGFFLLPMLTLLIIAPVSLLVIGPIMNEVSAKLAMFALAVINLSPMIAGFIIGGFWLLIIVPLGLHWGFMPIALNNLATLGYEPIQGLLIAGMFAAAGTLLAVGIKAKSKSVKSLAFSSALSTVLGISEPGLYGIILVHKQTFFTTFIGGAIGSAITGAAGTALHTFGGAAGIFSIPNFIPPTGIDASFIGALVGILVGFLVSFITTLLIKFDVDL